MPIYKFVCLAGRKAGIVQIEAKGQKKAMKTAKALFRKKVKLQAMGRIEDKSCGPAWCSLFQMIALRELHKFPTKVEYSPMGQ